MERFVLPPCRQWLALPLAALLASTALAQQPPYPSPRLASVFPPGAKAGETVTVTLSGSDLDDAASLYFSHSAIKGERIPVPPPKDKKKPDPNPPIQFKVTVPANAPLGTHDLRVIGKWGISNPRAFVVGRLPEAEEKEPNNDVPEAMRLEIGSVMNAVIGNKVDVDYFTFTGKAGQSIIAHVAASSIDSELGAEIKLIDSSGRELANNRFYRDRDALLSYKLPKDGDYLFRVCDFAYQNGGTESFYRLTLSTGPWIDSVHPPVVTPGRANRVTIYGRNLPGGKPVPKTGSGPALEELAVDITPPAPGTDEHFAGRLLPRSGSVDGFGYRLGDSNPVFIGYARSPVVLDAGGNATPETAQEVRLPADICGRIEARGDRDYYTFTAKKDDIVILEGLGDRLRSPVDLVLRLKRLENNQTLGEFDDNPAVPPTVDRLYTYTDDPLGRVVIPADGRYELMVDARDSRARGGPREVYCVRLRHEEPDFRLVVVGNHGSAAGLTLRRGANHDIQVVCFRRDGFTGPVMLSVEGLPGGVTCSPQVLGPALQDCSLVLSAAKNAADWVGPIVIRGTAEIDGKPRTHEAKAGCLVAPAANNAPAVSRLARSLCLAVRDPGPFRIAVENKPVAIPVGGSATFKVAVEAQISGYKDAVAVDLASGPAQSNGKQVKSPKVNIAPGKDGSIKFSVPSNAPPGEYNVVFRGIGKMTIEEPGTKKKRATEFHAVSSPISFTVFDSAGEVSFDPKPIVLQPGVDLPVTVRVKRLHDFKGEFTLELVPPSGSQGVSAASVKIPAGANEVKLVLKVDKNAKPMKDRAYRVRATAKVDSSTLKTETEVLISLDPMSAPGAKPANAKTIALVAEAAADWKYATGISGGDWLKPDFDDKAWKSVKAPFGNGEEAIDERKGTKIAETGQVVFARRVFDVPAEVLKNPDAVFLLQVASDNSAHVHLNGMSVDKDDADHEFSYWNREVAIPAKNLKPGRNVIAVQVNNTAGSSDVYLDVALSAFVPTDSKK